MVDQQQQQAAFVLHTRPYRETSLLVDLFTLDEGRVPVVARGARRPGSQLRSTLQPFSMLSVRYRGKEELKTLLAAETAQVSHMLKGKSLLCGLYANELLERLLYPLVSMPEVFLYYQFLLNELNSCEDIEAGLRTFERQLLKELGHWIDLTGLDQTYYRFSEGQGLVACGSETLGGLSLELLREIENDRYTQPTVRRGSKLLMRTMLNHLLGDKPLRSRTLFEKRLKPDQRTGSESE